MTQTVTSKEVFNFTKIVSKVGFVLFLLLKHMIAERAFNAYQVQRQIIERWAIQIF